MLNSKVIQTIKIDSYLGPFRLETGQPMQKMFERLALDIFDDAYHYINEDVALGLIYDEKAATPQQTFLLHERYYLGRSLQETIKELRFIEMSEEDLEGILINGIARISFYRDLLSAKDLLYSDLSVCQFDKVADCFKQYPMASEFVANVSDEEFAEAIKSKYRPRIRIRHQNKSTPKVIAVNVRILEIICNFLGITNASRYKPVDEDLGIAIFAKDDSPKESLKRLENILETIYNRKVEITDTRDMTYEDFDNFNSQFSRTMFTIVS